MTREEVYKTLHELRKTDPESVMYEVYLSEAVERIMAMHDIACVKEYHAGYDRAIDMVKGK